MKFNTPKPNLIYYKMYFLLGLLKNPKRFFNFIKYKVNRFKSTVNYKPLIMDLEPTQRCNFKCVMCINFKEKRKDMSFDAFKKIVDKQSGLMEMKIQGVGEPLLNIFFFKMIDYAMKKHLWVRTTTNASLLHINENYKKLVDSKVHDINISIDGATKEIYESIRLGSNFDILKQNCKLINDYNNKVKKTIIRAWVVIQKKNKAEFLKFPYFFHKLGFKEMTYSLSMHNYGRKGENTENTEFGFSKDLFKKLFEICKSLNIKLTFFFHPSFNAKQFCQIPFKRIYVTTDSHMLPCCYIANQEIINFGKHSDFEKIWYNKYNNFRKSMKNIDTVPDYCKNCYESKK